MKRGLYAITDQVLCAKIGFGRALEAALSGGARMVQYRDKSLDTHRRLQEATLVSTLCRRYTAISIINDDIALAKACSANGVHIGRDDDAIPQARTQLGPQAIIGVSCYDSLALARDAVAAGASYVAFGSFFPSPTKPNAVRANLQLIEQAKAEFSVPVIAIGGISMTNAGPLIAAGVDHIAVITALFAAKDSQVAAQALSALFPRQTNPGLI